MTLSPPSTGVFLDQDVVLICTIVLDSSVDTAVTVTVEWFNPSSTMIDSNMANMSNMSSSLTYTSTTTLTGFMVGDAGSYRCNVVVSSVRSFTRPSDSVSSTADIILSESLTLNCTHSSCTHSYVAISLFLIIYHTHIIVFRL